MLIILTIGIVCAVYSIYVYNTLVRKQAMAEEGFSGIDVQLKRRSDLIPQLVEVTKAYMAHERAVFEQVTALRTQAQGAATPGQRFETEAALGQALTRYMAVAENYPELKASSNFLDLQTQLSDIEDQIQMARRYYNGTVRDLNTLIEQVPSNLVAKFGGFRGWDYFRLADEGDRAVPTVALSS